MLRVSEQKVDLYLTCEKNLPVDLKAMARIVNEKRDKEALELFKLYANSNEEESKEEKKVQERNETDRINNTLDKIELLSKQEVIKSIGYDQNHVENFLFFSENLTQANEADFFEVMNFIKKRERYWILFHFYPEKECYGRDKLDRI